MAVRATGSAPLTYQWLRNGAPVAGATRDVLSWARITVGEAGEYRVRVMNSAGVETSAIAALTVAAEVPTPIVDGTFQGDPALDGQPTALLPLPDGRLLVAVFKEARSCLLRLQSDGRIDGSFVAAAVPGRISGMVAKTDGSLLVYPGWTLRSAALKRLNTDGSVDREFSLPSDLYPGNAAFGHAAQCREQPDGKILVLLSNGRLVRLLPDGDYDPAFVITPRIPSAVGGGIALAADGGIYVAIPGGGIRRLEADGRQDPAFAAGLPADAGSAGIRLFLTRDGKLLVNYTTWTGSGGTSVGSETRLVRLNANGGYDREFPSGVFLVAAPASDGRILAGNAGGRFSKTLRILSEEGAELPAPIGVFPNTLDYLGAFDAAGRVVLAGEFTFFNGVPTSHVVRLNRNPAESATPPRVVATWTEATEPGPGDEIVLRVAAVAPGPVTYEWSSDGVFREYWNYPRTIEPAVPVTPGVAGPFFWAVRAISAAGTSASEGGVVAVRRVPPAIVDQSRRGSLSPGREALLLVQLNIGTQITAAKWTKDGTVLPNILPSGMILAEIRSAPYPPTASYRVMQAAAADAGTYAVTVTDRTGAEVTSAPIVVTFDDRARLANVSVRAHVGSGADAAILGFVLPIGNSRSLLFRGIGPALEPWGIRDVLGDPWLDVRNAAGEHLGAADSWSPDSRNYYFDRVGAFRLPSGSVDAALSPEIGGLRHLVPGNYTIRLSGTRGETGLGLLELYEDDQAAERISNVAMRVLAGAGEAGAIAGFTLRGSAASRLLLRAAGPALGEFGLTGIAADPRLEMRDAYGRLLVANDDWGVQANAGAIAAAVSVGAFPFRAGSRDAAVSVVLPEGAYAAVVANGRGQSGLVLIEIYELP